MARLAPLRTPSSIRASSSAPIAPRGAPDPARRGVAVHSSSAADPNAAQSRDAPWSPCLALLRVCLYQNPTLNPPRYSTPGRDSHREPCLPFAEPFFGLAFFLLPPADLALFMAFPTALRVSVLTTAFTTTFPIPPMWLPIPTFSRDSCAKERRAALGPAFPSPPLVRTLVGSLRALETSTLGVVLYLYLLAPYVFLDRPGVLYHPSRVAPSRLWVAVRECSLRVGITLRPQWVQLGRSRKPSARSKEAHVGKRGRCKGSQGRAEDRVRGRVRERVQGRPERREVSSTGRRRSTFNVGAIEGFANRFTDHGGGTSGLAGAASGLAGAASGLAGGSFAHRILDSDTESSEEDFNNEVRQRLDLIDERLQRLEEQVQTFLEAGGGAVQEPEGGTDPDSSS